ncbi:MAG: hypothetical protein AMJ75_04790 [Phycisphaerae bacterium SM1_79]|nr:MAG: hypothetical protein AMJ75_04790 [Phycisphaerae bacterium SM1_79]
MADSQAANSIKSRQCLAVVLATQASEEADFYRYLGGQEDGDTVASETAKDAALGAKNGDFAASNGEVIRFVPAVQLDGASVYGTGITSPTCSLARGYNTFSSF